MNCLFIYTLILSILCNLLLAESTRSSSRWWKNTIIYEVYIRSFKDSDGDGVGDINGITEKLDHFVDLNIESLWLTPYFKSPMEDMGYDVSNYTAIHPPFGNMDDFDRLSAEMRKRNMKLIMDFVINHSSDQHPWFIKSIDRIEPYTNYYIWRDPKGYDKYGKPIPPNNWISEFTRESAWEWNEKRGQFYYHVFAICQPDLNLRNPIVVNEIKKIMAFWISHGVHSFRLDATPYLIENIDMIDNPSDKKAVGIYQMNQPDTLIFMNQLRRYLDKTYNKNGKIDGRSEKIFISEAVQEFDVLLTYYGNETFKTVHYPFNFDLNRMETFPDASRLDTYIRTWVDNIPKGDVVNWVTDTHDLPRTACRLNEHFRDILVTLTMMLPGAVSMYYGQEIGMKCISVRDDHKQDLQRTYRDLSRSPMQWDDTDQAGFSTNRKPWLPVNPDYWTLNVQSQKSQNHSHYNMFKALSKLRKTETTIKFGKFKSYIPSKWVYVFTRTLAHHKTYIILLNLGSEVANLSLPLIIPAMPGHVRVFTASMNAGYRARDVIKIRPMKLNGIHMRPSSSIVCETF